MLHPPCCSDYNPDSVPHFWNPTGAPLHPSISHDEQDLTLSLLYRLSRSSQINRTPLKLYHSSTLSNFNLVIQTLKQA